MKAVRARERESEGGGGGGMRDILQGGMMVHEIVQQVKIPKSQLAAQLTVESRCRADF